MVVLDNTLLDEGLRELRRRLPPGWSVTVAASPHTQTALATFSVPDGTAGAAAVVVRAVVEPRDVAAVAEAAAARAEPTVVVSRYLSPTTRDRLRDRGLGYLDLTGNVRLVLARPAVWVEGQGAEQDPSRQERPARSLRGAQAGRLVRALVDNATPRSVRDLAAATGTDPGYVSRVLAFLDTEALVTRDARGRLTSVDWPALLRRWAAEAPLSSRGRATMWLEPRGLSVFTSKLATFAGGYAITGSLAATRLAPVAPPRLATLWVRNAEEIANALGLRAAEAGANVQLVQMSDELPLLGATEAAGLRYAAPSQLVADLLGSPGRAPAEADALLTWMREHEGVWRG